VDEVDRAFPDGPPADPEEWSDEQWLEWLKATDNGAPATTEQASRTVTTGGRIAHSAGGQVLGQTMLAVAQAVFGRHDDEVVIVAEAGSEPGDDEPFSVHLDPEHPERSSVVFKRPPNPPA
jgi:hypothetical protein